MRLELIVAVNAGRLRQHLFAIPPSSIIKKKRVHRNSTEEREAKKGDFIKMHRLNLLLMQKNAEAERQQRREEQRVIANS